MKNLLLICICTFILACGQEKKEDNAGSPRIQFSLTEFDFGNIIMGEKVSHRFVFKNTGDADLKIENIISSCGCTVVNYDKKPISPDNESFVEVLFDSQGYRGLQMKQIEVYSNCDSSKTTLKLWAKISDLEE